MTPAEIRRQLLGMSPEELLDARDKLDAELRLLHRDGGKLRKLDPQEQEEYDEARLAREQIQTQLDQHARVRDGFRQGRYETAFRGVEEEGVGNDVDVMRLSGEQARALALRALEMQGDRSKLKADQLDRVEELIRLDADSENPEASYLSRRTLLTMKPAYRAAWARLMTQPHPVLTGEEASAVRDWERFDRWESRAMSEGTPASGGYGIPVFIDPSIILTAQGTLNPFMQLCRVVDVNTNAWKGVTSQGVSWSFDPEGSAVSDDSPTLAQPAITVFMPRGFLPYSIEVGQDYPGFAEEMTSLLAVGYDELLIQKFTSGSGSGEPMGLITALDADTNSEVRLTTAGSFGAADVYNVWNQLPQRFRRRASWLMNVATNSGIRQFGNYLQLHAQTVQLPEGWAGEILGRAVYDNPYMSGVVNTTGSFNQLVVGDFSNYIIPRRAGMSTELVPVLFDVTSNRPTGQRGIFAWARIGGGAITPGFRLLNQT